MNWAKALRMHQWVKNLLLFIPLITAHKIFTFYLLNEVLFAFISFSLVASAGYIFNDIYDIQEDRVHPLKNKRPFASGELSIKQGILIILCLLLISFGISFSLVNLFKYILITYLVLSMSYTVWIKKYVLLDVVILAIFYNIRIIAGGIAVNIPISSWLLNFSMFFFMSLAFIKRYGELIHLKNSNMILSNRGYLLKDASIIKIIGLSNGYISILVLIFYIYSDHVTKLYQQPILLWLVIPVIMYWLSRLWLLTHRGKITYDPIIFMLKDSVSYYSLIIVLIIFYLSKVYNWNILNQLFLY